MKVRSSATPAIGMAAGQGRLYSVCVYLDQARGKTFHDLPRMAAQGDNFGHLFAGNFRTARDKHPVPHNGENKENSVRLFECIPATGGELPFNGTGQGGRKPPFVTRFN
jgi:hypothetical protein